MEKIIFMFMVSDATVNGWLAPLFLGLWWGRTLWQKGVGEQKCHLTVTRRESTEQEGTRAKIYLFRACLQWPTLLARPHLPIILWIQQGITPLIQSETSGFNHFPKAHQLASKPQLISLQGTAHIWAITDVETEPRLQEVKGKLAAGKWILLSLKKLPSLEFIWPNSLASLFQT
jgi:hypothetical protein